MMTPMRNRRKNIRQSAQKRVPTDPTNAITIFLTPWMYWNTLRFLMTFVSRITRTNFMSLPRRRRRVDPTDVAIWVVVIWNTDTARMRKSNMFHSQSGPRHRAPAAITLMSSSTTIQPMTAYSRLKKMPRSSAFGACALLARQRSTPMAYSTVAFDSMATAMTLSKMTTAPANLNQPFSAIRLNKETLAAFSLGTTATLLSVMSCAFASALRSSRSLVWPRSSFLFVSSWLWVSCTALIWLGRDCTMALAPRVCTVALGARDCTVALGTMGCTVLGDSPAPGPCEVPPTPASSLVSSCQLASIRDSSCLWPLAWDLWSASSLCSMA
mmetsp:Transcript_1966/g.5778  ORF Transcript_1966/g.5778 Transcript_1966/m.5778 type:complete len:326 (-) Transcript_1966:149-1126(-)